MTTAGIDSPGRPPAVYAALLALRMAFPKDDPAHDLQLVRAAQARQETAVAALAERLRCVPRILGAQNARLGRPLDEHDVADVAQDVVVVLLRKLGEYDGRVGFEGWAFRICTYELMNAIRRRRRALPAIDLVEQPATDAAAAAEWQRLLEREALERALDRVGSTEAEALRLKHWEGLTFEEMAARLGTSVANAKARYYRGLARLEEIVHADERRENES